MEPNFVIYGVHCSINIEHMTRVMCGNLITSLKPQKLWFMFTPPLILWYNNEQLSTIRQSFSFFN